MKSTRLGMGLLAAALALWAADRALGQRDGRDGGQRTETRGVVKSVADGSITITIAEGGREGPRKLQGFRAINEAHARTRGVEMLAELRAFLRGSPDLDWGLQARTRPLADAAIAELAARFEAAP